MIILIYLQKSVSIMAKKKVKLYNPSNHTTKEYDAETAERLLAYQERVKSKTRLEKVTDKKKTENTDD